LVLYDRIGWYSIDSDRWCNGSTQQADVRHVPNLDQILRALTLLFMFGGNPPRGCEQI